MKLSNESLETLDRAIEDFNEWNGSALIYFNVEGEYFNTEVFLNDVQATETVLNDNVYGVFSKNESQDLPIGEKRKEYIIKFGEMLLDGRSPDEISYNLSHYRVY